MDEQRSERTMAKRSRAKDSDEPELPRVEPEIIPPDHSGRSDFWRRGSFGGSRYVYTTTRIGPFGLALLLMAVGAIVAIFLITLVGAVLIWIPFVILIAAIAGLVRFFARR
jgi:hypothetical protein